MTFYHSKFVTHLVFLDTELFSVNKLSTRVKTVNEIPLVKTKYMNNTAID